MTRDEYIAYAVRAAELVAGDLAVAKLGKPPSQGEKDADTYALLEGVVDVDRVERARKYAEWRWDGFHAGEIASL
jgi:hypothetical protein